MRKMMQKFTACILSVLIGSMSFPSVSSIVIADSTDGTDQSASDLMVTINPAPCYVIGATADIPISISGTIPEDAWITFVPSDIPHTEKDGDEHNGDYQRLYKIEGGIAHISAPGTLGSYDIRVYDGEDENTAREIACRTVSIVYSTLSTAAVRVDSRVVKPGEDVRVYLTLDGQFRDDAWVSFIPTEIEHSEKVSDDYNADYARLTEIEDGYVTITAPSQGSWDIRLFDGEDGDYAKELAYVTLLVTDSEDASVPVADGKATWNGNTYQYFDKGMTWDEAEAYCESLGGHLATITSAEEQEVVTVLTYGGTKLNYWLGGQQSEDGIWSWITGERFSFTHWQGGLPDNYAGLEDSLMLWRSNGLWNDLPRHGSANNGDFAESYNMDTIGFVCEWDNPDTYSAGSKAYWNGNTYQYFDKFMTWEEAEAYCESLGGHLVTITSAAEQSAVQSLLNSTGRKVYWIGGRSTALTLSWVTGEDTAYTNWHPGQPDNALVDGNGDHLVIQNTGSGFGVGTWGDTDGEGVYFGPENTGFICEWDSTDTPQGLTRSAFSHIEAEEYQDATERVQSATGYGTGTCIGWIADGYYIAYTNIDFGKGGTKSAIISAAAYYDTRMEIRLDSADGKLLGTCTVPGKSDWHDFSEYACAVPDVSGIHDVYLVCRSDIEDADVINLDYFTFSKKAAPNVITPTEPTTEPVETTKPAETTEPVSTELRKGDVNLDGTVDIMDVILINKFLLGSAKLGTVSKNNADADSSGTVDTTDSLLILKYVVEIIDSFGETPEQTDFTVEIVDAKYINDYEVYGEMQEGVVTWKVQMQGNIPSGEIFDMDIFSPEDPDKYEENGTGRSWESMKDQEFLILLDDDEETTLEIRIYNVETGNLLARKAVKVGTESVETTERSDFTVEFADAAYKTNYDYEGWTLEEVVTSNLKAQGNAPADKVFYVGIFYLDTPDDIDFEEYYYTCYDVTWESLGDYEFVFDVAGSEENELEIRVYDSDTGNILARKTVKIGTASA